MQIAANTSKMLLNVGTSSLDVSSQLGNGGFVGDKVIRRNGATTGFESSRILAAMTKAILASKFGQGSASERVSGVEVIVTRVVVDALGRRQPRRRASDIEGIQVSVEPNLIRVDSDVPFRGAPFVRSGQSFISPRLASVVG